MNYIKAAYTFFTPGESIGEKLEQMCLNGFTALETDTLRTAEDRKSVRKAVSDAGLHVHSVMNNDHWPFPLSRPEREVRSRSLEGLVQALDTAVELGADSVLVVPGVVSPDVPHEEAVKWAADSISRALLSAQERNIMLLLENCNAKFLYSCAEFIAFIDQFQSLLVSGYLDVGNVMPYGYPEHWIRAWGKRVRKVHFKGFNYSTGFSHLLDGSQDWGAVMRALRDIGYEGYITSEVGAQQPEEFARMSKEMDSILTME